MIRDAVPFRIDRGIIWLIGLVLLAACAAVPATTTPSTSSVIASPRPATARQPSTAPSATMRRSPTRTVRPPSATPRPASPVPPTVPPTPAATLAPAPLLSGMLVTQTDHLDLYRIEGGLLITALLDLAPQFEQAIEQVGARMGGRLSGRVALSFEPSQRGPCALRGLTLSHQRIIQLYYAPETPSATVLAIVAHELAHELQHDYYGWPAHQKSDVILLEGQATWASADYARGQDGRPAWDSRARQALAEGNLLPLTADLEADCRTTTRNAAYTGWASFVDFLIKVYGRQRFDALYRSGPGRASGSADYAGIYGRSLDALDQEWRAWLADQDRSP